MNMTVDDLKRMSVDETVVDLVAEVLFTEAKAQVIRQAVDEYLKPVFEQFDFRVTLECHGHRPPDFGEKITDEKQIYLDADEEKCKRYWAACREEHLKHDFADVVLQHEASHGGDQGWCPALISEHQFIKAKRSLADHVATKWLGLKEINYPHSDKLVDIVLKAVINGPAGADLRKKGKLALCTTE